MLTTLLFLITTCLTISFANAESEWMPRECSDKPSDLRDALLVPTQSMTIPFGNDSQGGKYETTIVRQKIDSRTSNRFAVDLPDNTDVSLDPETTYFEHAGYKDGGLLFKTKNRDTFYFYCGKCKAQGRNVIRIDDLLSLKNSDGSPFFKVMCKKRTKPNPVVPANDVPPAEELPTPVET